MSAKAILFIKYFYIVVNLMFIGQSNLDIIQTFYQQFQIQTVTYITNTRALLCSLESLNLSLVFLALIDRISSSRSSKKRQDVRNKFDLRLNKKLQ